MDSKVLQGSSARKVGKIWKDAGGLQKSQRQKTAKILLGVSSIQRISSPFDSQGATSYTLMYLSKAKIINSIQTQAAR
ncbi:hypothetical protein I7I48_08961 [Histoplasma ohiense]|nr:hypothetical protein I7I48_08961 [Histoplasma ohiense (nom. inval.)]